MSLIAIRVSRIYSNSSWFESKPSLVRFIGFLFLFALIVGSIPRANAQTRPRRVGDTKSLEGTSPSSISSLPSQPPALRGTGSSGQSPATQNQRRTQEGPEEVGEGDIVRVNTTLVTIPVSVMDRDGKYIPNLRKEDFRIWDQGVEQQAAYFASTEQPFTVGLMIDTGGSTHFNLEEIQDAAISFENQLQENDPRM